MKLKRTSAVTLLIVFFCINTFAVNISAAEKKSGRISLENSVPGMVWDIYRTGDALEDGTLKPDKKFSGYRIPSKMEHREEIQTLAYTFESYINIRNVKPVDSRAADDKGTAVFTDLAEGWYTAVPRQLVKDGMLYESGPVMVCVSSYEIYSDVWGTDVRVCPKVNKNTKIPENKKKIVIRYEPDPTYPDSDEPVNIIIYRDDEEYYRLQLDRDNDWTYVLPEIPDDDTKWSVILETTPEDVYPLYRKETDRTDITPVDTFIVTHRWDYNNTVLYPLPTFTAPPGSPDDEPEVTATVTEELIPENTTVPVMLTPEETEPPVITRITEESRLPQTGQLWWPVPLLAVCGAAFIGAGAVVRVKEDDE